MKERKEQFDSLNSELHAAQTSQKENEASLKNLDVEMKEVRAEVKKAKKQRDAAESTSSTLTLFKDISNVTWDYQSESIKGHVSRSERHDVNPFEFDDSMTKFETTNKIWELIGTA